MAKKTSTRRTTARKTGTAIAKREALAISSDMPKKLPKTGSHLTQLIGGYGATIEYNVFELLGTLQQRYVNTETRLRMRNDPDVAFGLAILRAPILNLKWSIESEDPDIASFVDQVIRRKYRTLAAGGSMAIPFGFQFLEKVWRVRPVTVERENLQTGQPDIRVYPQAWVIDDYKALDPRNLKIVTDEKVDDWIGVEQYSMRGGKTNRASRENLFFWSYRREDVWGKLQGYPILNQCFEPWIWKAAMNLLTNRYFERKADPVPKARADAEVEGPDGSTLDGFQYMADQLISYKAGGAIILPPARDKDGKYTFDFEYLMDDKRGDMFQQRLDYLGTQILRALWITDRVGTTGTIGAKAEAVVHAETMASMLEANIKEWIENLNEQIVNPLVLYNFGPEALERSKTMITSAGLTELQKTLNKELILALLQTEAMQLGGQKVKLADRIDVEAVLKQTGIALRSAEELRELKQIEPTPTPNPVDDMKADEAAVADDLIARGHIEDEGAANIEE